MKNTPARGGAQERTCKPRKKPSPADPGALSVSDGALHLGWVVPDPDSGSFFAFDWRAELLGEFPSQLEASRAIPLVDDVGGLT